MLALCRCHCTTDPSAERDARTLDKLYDGVNDTYDDKHMWLAPYTPGQSNSIFIYFDHPVTLSMVKVCAWPSRQLGAVPSPRLAADLLSLTLLVLPATDLELRQNGVSWRV